MKSPDTNQPIVAPSTAYRNKHHRRRWYKRWWRSFVKGRGSKLVLLALLLAIALAIGYLGSRSDTILPNRPRRMVLNKTTTAWIETLNALAIET